MDDIERIQIPGKDGSQLVDESYSERELEFMKPEGDWPKELNSPQISVEDRIKLLIWRYPNNDELGFEIRRQFKDDKFEK